MYGDRDAHSTQDRNFYAYIESLITENERQRKREQAIEDAFGVPLPRCPICLGRREKAELGRACAYCGVVET